VYFKGYYGPDLSILLSRLTRPGMIALDVGSNVGAYALLFAAKVGPTGRVYCFEPNPEVRQRLIANIRLNDFEARTTILSTALSISPGNAVLYVPKRDHYNRGIASLYKHAEVLGDQVSVQVETLDRVVAELKLERLDLIKIDTDGSDADVILGGETAIGTYRPLIVFETLYLPHPDASQRLQAARALLSDMGYRFCTVGFAGRRIPLGTERQLPETDIVCIPQRYPE
jgi:FkbM family methyltransferase